VACQGRGTWHIARIIKYSYQTARRPERMSQAFCAGYMCAYVHMCTDTSVIPPCVRACVRAVDSGTGSLALAGAEPEPRRDYAIG
jgi:hypothetical protein